MDVGWPTVSGRFSRLIDRTKKPSMLPLLSSPLAYFSSVRSPPISAGQKRSTFLGLPEKLLGTGRPPGESAPRKRLIDFPRVERSTRDVKVQRPQEPQADQTTATAVCQAQHRRRCVAQSPLLNHPRDTINRFTWPSHVLRFSGQKLRSLLPDCCRMSLRGNRRSLSGVSHDPERSDSLL